MESLADDMNITQLEESPIAGRTRSMQKRLSMSQNSPSTPLKTPKKSRNKSRNSSPIESNSPNIESRRKSTQRTVKSDKSFNSKSSNSENLDSSLTVTRSLKSKNAKDMKMEEKTMKVMVKSFQQPESEQSEIQEGLLCNGDVRKNRKRAQRSGSAKEFSSKSESCDDFDKIKESKQKCVGKSKRSIGRSKIVSSNNKCEKLEEEVEKESEEEEYGRTSSFVNKDIGPKKSRHSKGKLSIANLSSDKDSCEISDEKTLHSSSTKKRKKSAKDCAISSDSSNNSSSKNASVSTIKKRNLEIEASSSVEPILETKELDVVSSASVSGTSSKKANRKLIKSQQSKLDIIKIDKNECNDREVTSEDEPNTKSPSQPLVTSDKNVHKRSSVASTSNLSTKLDSNEDETMVGIEGIQSPVKLGVQDNKQKLVDSNDVHFSSTEHEKRQNDSGGTNKINQLVSCQNKIINIKKDIKIVNNIHTAVEREKKSIPNLPSQKYKSFVVENLNTSLKNKSCQNNPLSKETNSNYPDSDSDAESRKAIMESAQRRIEQNLSTSESDSRYLAKVTHKNSVRKPTVEAGSSDSGSAPEHVSFETGRKSAMESLKNAVESIQREKQRRKAKRKERLEKLKQQKEEKLIRLKEKLASQEDASCSSSEESGYEETCESKRGKKKRVPKSRALRTEKENVDGSSVMVLKKTAFSDMESDDSSTKAAVTGQVPTTGGLKRLPSDVIDSLPDQIPMKYPKISQEENNKKKRKKERMELKDGPDKDFKKPTNLDYIPLEIGGPTKFGVVPLEKALKAPKSVSQQAADFRQNMLYGSHVKREPAKSNVIYQQKLKASGNDIHVR